MVVGLFVGLVEFPVVEAWTGTVSYDAGSDTITCFGGSAGDPIRFSDLYEADVDGGWSQISLQGANQYLVDCKIVIGNGVNSTYFWDGGGTVGVVQVEFIYESSENYEKLIYVNASATLQFGDAWSYLYDGGYLPSMGVHLLVDYLELGRYIIYSADSSSANVYLYSSSFAYYGWGSGAFRYNPENSNNKIVGCIFTNQIVVDYFGGLMFRCNFVNQAWQVGSPFMRGFSGSAIVNDVFCSNGGAVFQVGYSGAANYTWRNVFAGKYLNALEFYDNSYGTVGVYLVDCDLDNWLIYWSGNNDDVTVYRQYSFDVVVLNGDITDFVEDANVTLWHNGSVVSSYLSNSSGWIPSQVLTYGWYNETGDDSMYGGTPYTLTITHPDWATYNSTFYIADKMLLTVSMQEPSVEAQGLAAIAFIIAMAAIGITVLLIKKR